MLAYVVCAEVFMDSYHSLVLVTLDREEAENLVKEHNAKHDPECYEMFKDYHREEKCCGCRLYHMHTIPIKGIMPRFRNLVRELAKRGLLSQMSGSESSSQDLTNPARL